MTIEATMNSKGQVTLPKKVRELLGLESGDKVEFYEKNGNVYIRAKARVKTSITEVAGALVPYTAVKATVKEMDEGIEAYLGKKYGSQ